MAILVVDDISEVNDLAQLIAHLSRALADGNVGEFLEDGTLTLRKTQAPTPQQVADLVGFDDTDECDRPDHREGCSCRTDAAGTDPRQGIVLEAPHHDGPVPYLPCPRQGTHQVLTECWMCWSDVHRGTLPLHDALSAP